MIGICKVENCKEKAYRNGYCNRHEIQMRRHGKITDTKVIDLGNEQWRTIEGYNGRYKVSDCGRVKAITGTSEKLMKHRFENKKKNSRGRVRLSMNKVFQDYYVYKLVLDAFKTNPNNETTAVFIDGDHRNCCSDNVEWYGVYWFDKAMTMLESNGSHEAKKVLKFMKGDNNAINDILEKETSRLIGLVSYLNSFWKYKYNANAKLIEAEDIVQESMKKAISSIRKGGLRETSRLSGWFSCIAKGLLINAYTNKTNLKTKSQVCDNGCDYIDYAIFNKQYRCKLLISSPTLTISGARLWRVRWMALLGYGISFLISFSALIGISFSSKYFVFETISLARDNLSLRH